MLVEFLYYPFLDKPLWLWLIFMAIVLTLLILDLGLLHKDQHVISVKESLLMSAGYIFVALLFGSWIWWEMGPESGINYLTGFLVEKTLALDNIFVISLIFSYFCIPPIYQYRVLFLGILSAIILRGIMIGFGTSIVQEFSWILYIFGAFLILTGIKMLFTREQAKDLGENFLVRFLYSHLRVTKTLHDKKFFIKAPHPETGKILVYATPLFVALIMVEFVDIIFAVDSVPAIFAITTDPYIVYTSNIFAILGLRALYFGIEAIIHRFAYLKYALAAVLIFIGCKIYWNHFFTKIDPIFSLAITISLLTGGILVSLLKTKEASLSK